MKDQHLAAYRGRKGERTVGGTSLVALRPGFFRGGRTQVLLNASLAMSSGWIAAGEDKRGGEGWDGRGARAAESPVAEAMEEDEAMVVMRPVRRRVAEVRSENILGGKVV